MHKLTKRKKRFLVVVLVVVLLIPSINITNNLIVYNKIKSFEENNNQSLFELCKYLYDTNEYIEIYKYFSLVFKQFDVFKFFTNIGLSSDQAINYITLWGSKYLISSVLVNKEESCNEFNHVFKIVQDLGVEKAFFVAVKKQIKDDYGVIIDYFELYKLKKFLGYMASSIENVNKPEFKIECYSFLVSQYSSFGDFETSDKYSRKIEREKYINNLTDEAEV